MLKKLFVRAGVPVSFGLAALPAFAAIDTTDIVAEITGAMVPIAAIGMAVLTIHYGAKVFKWVRKAG